jgi:hypothetical protein
VNLAPKVTYWMNHKILVSRDSYFFNPDQEILYYILFIFGWQINP